MNGKKSIDFEEYEIDKLFSGGCVEKFINGEKILVCGTKIDVGTATENDTENNENE